VRKTCFPKAQNQGQKLLAGVGFLTGEASPGWSPGGKCFSGIKSPENDCSWYKFR